MCSNTAIAEIAAEIDRRESVPVLPEPTEEYVWAGNDYGYVKPEDFPKSRCLVARVGRP